MIVNRSLKHTDGAMPESKETYKIPEKSLVAALANPPFPIIKYSEHIIFMNPNDTISLYEGYANELQQSYKRSPEPSGTVVTLIQE